MNLSVELPDDLSAQLQLSPAAIQGDVRLALAIDWCRRGMLSEERAATVARLTLDRFRDELAARKTDHAALGRADARSAFSDDEDQIAERLSWTPRERLQYLLDMLAFEERARAARLVASIE